MTQAFLTTKIANTTVRLPIYKDRETTLGIAQEITERIEALVETSDRIDTQAFALQTAFDLATELHDLKEDQAGDEREIIVALEKLASRITALTNPE